MNNICVKNSVNSVKKSENYSQPIQQPKQTQEPYGSFSLAASVRPSNCGGCSYILKNIPGVT
jgi:hypothetical protein